MERYYGFDFDKRRYGMFGNVNTNRVLTFGGGFDWGDEVYFDGANAFLGRESGFRTFINFRPVSRFATNINITTSRFTDPLGLFTVGVNDGERGEDGEIFNVNIFRALNTYQVTDRLALAQHHRVQHLGREDRPQLPRHLPRQLGDRVLHRVRRSLPAAPSVLRRPGEHHRPRLPADEPRRLHQDPVSVPVLTGVGEAVRETPAGTSGPTNAVVRELRPARGSAGRSCAPGAAVARVPRPGRRARGSDGTGDR